jgi:hypothetical protein
VQVTVVSPTGNEEPLGGEQVVVTGAVPFSAVGLPYTTFRELPSGATSVSGSGQEMVGGWVGGGVTLGRDGLEQPLAATVVTRTTVSDPR